VLEKPNNGLFVENACRYKHTYFYSCFFYFQPGICSMYEVFGKLQVSTIVISHVTEHASG
jgi:hypothetical protein